MSANGEWVWIGPLEVMDDGEAYLLSGHPLVDRVGDMVLHPGPNNALPDHPALPQVAVWLRENGEHVERLRYALHVTENAVDPLIGSYREDGEKNLAVLRSLVAALAGSRPEPPERVPAAERDEWGRTVREAWVSYCRETGDTKPSHIAPWDELSEWDKEADRRIAEAVLRRLAGGTQRTDAERDALLAEQPAVHEARDPFGNDADDPPQTAQERGNGPT